MGKTQRIFAVVFFISTLLLSRSSHFVRPVFASDDGICKLNQGDFDKIESIKNDPALDYFGEIKLELQLRKNLLKNVLRCAINDANDLRTATHKIRLNDQDAINLRSLFANQLDNVVSYYQTQESKIDDLGLQGSKDFAKNLELWRDGNYKQVAKMATNFLIWGKNQEIIETAQARVNQIGRSVTLLSLVYKEDIGGLWREVDDNFSEAKKFNQQVKNDLRFATPNDALATIKSSLDSLSKTYEKLSELVNAINQALAIPS